MLTCQCTHERQDAVVQKHTTNALIHAHQQLHSHPPHTVPPVAPKIDSQQETQLRPCRAVSKSVLASQHTSERSQLTGQYSPAAAPKAVLTTGLPLSTGIPPHNHYTMLLLLLPLLCYRRSRRLQLQLPPSSSSSSSCCY